MPHKYHLYLIYFKFSVEFLIKGSNLNSTIVTIILVAHIAKTTKQKILELKKGNLLQKKGPYRLETSLETGGKTA